MTMIKEEPRKLANLDLSEQRNLNSSTKIMAKKFRIKYQPGVGGVSGYSGYSGYSDSEAKVETSIIKFTEPQPIELNLKQIDLGSLINNLDAIFAQKYIPKNVLATVIKKNLEDNSI